MSFSGISCAVHPVSKVGSIADRVQGISPFWYRFGAVFNAHVRAFSLCLSRLAGFEKDCFHGMQLLDTGSFLPVFVVMGVLFGGKPLDFRLQGFMAWQLGNAMRPKITGGCVRYDKIAFVPFPVGAAGFSVFCAFRPSRAGLVLA